MNKNTASNLAVISLVLACISIAIVAVAAARHFMTGSADDPLLQLFASQQTIQNIGVFIAIIKVSHYVSILAALAIMIGSYVLKNTRGTKERTSRRIALAAVILAFATILSCLTSILVYTSTIKKVADNITAMTDTKSVEEFLRNDIDIVFGTPTPTISGSGKQLIEVPVTITNKKSDAQDYIIVYDAVNETGERIAQNSIYTVRLGAEQTQEYKSTFYYLDAAQLAAMPNATFKITSIMEH